jgi:hypothetical protein
MSIPKHIMKMTPAQVIAKFSSEEREWYDEFEESHQAKADGDRWWYWELGQETSAMLQEKRANPDEKVWGEYVVERMSRALVYDSDTTMRNCMRVYDRFPTKTKYTAVTRHKDERGNGLSWTHLVHISAIQEDAMVTKLAKLSLLKGWPAVRLLEEVRKINGDKRGTGGRPLKTPECAADALHHLDTMCDKFTRQFDTNWFGENFDIADALGAIAPDDVTEVLHGKVQEVRKKMCGLQAKLSTGQQVLLEAEPVLEAKLNGGKQATISMQEHRRKNRPAKTTRKKKRA